MTGRLEETSRDAALLVWINSDIITVGLFICGAAEPFPQTVFLPVGLFEPVFYLRLILPAADTDRTLIVR